MFYSAFGFIENFEDINNSQEVNNSQKVNNNQEVNNSQPIDNKNNDEEIRNTYINVGFNNTNTITRNNFLKYQKKINLEIYNLPIVDSININKFLNNTVGIQMSTLFDFKFSYNGINKPFNSNIVNYNKNKNKNKITFKYFDQYGYELNLVSDELINDGLYNILYLPIQKKTDITSINSNNLTEYNSYNGSIITITTNLSVYAPYNKLFELYIFPTKNINLIVIYNFKEYKYNLPENVYSYLYINPENSDIINIIQLNIVNLNFITIPNNIKLNENTDLIYNNNFLNFDGNKFYNMASKQYDTVIMNCTFCDANVKDNASRFSKLAYNGTENSYLRLPNMDLSSKIISFSINFKTSNTNNQVLFDIGNLSEDGKYINSLFVAFENNTVRFNYIKNNEIKSTFLYAEGNPKLNDNKWHNIIWTLNNDKWIIYIDTIKIFDANKITPNKYSFKTTSTNNLIGKKNNINNFFPEYTNFIGLIDNFKVFNRELTSLEITNENIK